MACLLKRINWLAVNRATKQQIRNREVHCPPISMFRWWARRPHTFAGALLEAAKLSSRDLVSDPFSGGGTVTIEAAVRGHRVYAQDLNPWPTWGLQTALADSRYGPKLRCDRRVECKWLASRQDLKRFHSRACRLRRGCRCDQSMPITERH